MDNSHDDLQGKESKGSSTEQTSGLCGLGSSTSELRDGRRGSSRSAVAGSSSSVAGGRTSSAGDGAGNAAGSRLDGAGDGLSSRASRLGDLRGHALGCRRSSGGCRCDGRAGCGCGLGNLDGHAGLLAGLLDGRDGGLLVVGLASALNAGLDGAEELGALLAVAGKVGQAVAAVGGEGADEAVQLRSVSRIATTRCSSKEESDVRHRWECC